MHIRKYTAIFTTILIMGLITFIYFYQNYYSNKLSVDMEKNNGYFRFVKTDGKEIQIYKDGKWEEIKLKGVELSSFQPGYARHKSSIDKKDVIKWLEQISKLNANLIKIPNIQPPSFYNGIYEYNLKASKPIYIIHEVRLDEKEILNYYNAYHKKIIKNFKKDIKNTINVIHGRALIIDNSRTHRGVYLKDISDYNIGYIIGTNTNPEMIILTNSKNHDRIKYNGKYFKVEDGTPFEVFMGKMIDFAISYEVDKYKQLSLISYLTSIETDPLEYKHEPNRTRYAKINIENIKPIFENNLFVSYNFHPNAVDFLDYEYEKSNIGDHQNSSETVFFKHLKKLNHFYSIPLVISDTGIPSSRGMSKIDKNDGFHRGRFSEKEQGENIAKLLKAIYESGSSGGIINSWQDNWTNITSFSLLKDYLDESASSYWFDAQSSDESFGLLAFEAGKKEKKIYIDGDVEEWEAIDDLIDEKNIRLKVKSDPAFLYMFIEKENWSLSDDRLYIGIDMTPISGSNYWEKEKVRFSMPVDFIVKLNGYTESRILVHERYDIFSYLYTYYSNIIEKKDKIPEKNSSTFSPIYLLNRKKFYLRGTEKIIPPVYYETGRLVYGNNNPKDENYNSLADFNKKKNIVEIKIPWGLLNVKNPLEGNIYDDFYKKGIESKIKIKDIGFSIYTKDEEKATMTKEKRYTIETYKDIKYYERLKKSYKIVQKYWQNNPKIKVEGIE